MSSKQKVANAQANGELFLFGAHEARSSQSCVIGSIVRSSRCLRSRGRSVRMTAPRIFGTDMIDRSDTVTADG